MYAGMAPMQNPADTASALEPDGAEARRARIARETRWLGEARALAEQGHAVSEAQVDAWVDSLGEKDELPPPRSGL